MAEKTKILIIDDMTSHLLLLRTIFEEDGFEVITSENGENALESLKNDKAVELILLDIMMPEFDGFDFLDKINEFETNKVPVIVVSAKNDNASIKKAIDKGAYDYLTKPFNIQDVRNKVKSALG